MQTIPYHPLQNCIHIHAVLRKHRFILWAAPILVMIITSLVLISLPARYEASGLMQVMPHANDGPLSSGPSVLPNDSMVLSHVEMLRSSAVLKKVAEELNLGLSAVQGSVSVTPIGRSYIIRVSAEARKPETAQIIANQVMRTYQAHQRSLDTARMDGTSIWLNEQVTLLAKQVREAARAAALYRQEHHLPANTVIPITSQQLSDISTRLIAAQTTEAENDARKGLLSDAATSAGMKSPALSALNEQETLLRLKLGELQQKYQPRHPALKAAQAELAALKIKQQQEIAKIRAAITSEHRLATRTAENIARQLDSLDEKKQAEHQAEIRLQELDENEKATRVLYEGFLRRAKETGFYAELPQLGIQPVSWAELPDHRSNPNPLLIIMMCGLAAFFIALLVVLLQEQFSHPEVSA